MLDLIRLLRSGSVDPTLTELSEIALRLVDNSTSVSQELSEDTESSFTLAKLYTARMRNPRNPITAVGVNETIAALEKRELEVYFGTIYMDSGLVCLLLTLAPEYIIGITVIPLSNPGFDYSGVHGISGKT